MTITEGRKLYNCVNGILNLYHIICYPYLGLGICTMIRITCACIYCINSIDLPWDPYLVQKDQPGCFSVKKLKYYPILGKHNDCLIINSIYKGADEY